MPNTEQLRYQTDKAATGKLLLKISQYSQENTCVGASSSVLLKRDPSTGVLLSRSF